MTQLFIGAEVGAAQDHERRGVIVDSHPTQGWLVFWTWEGAATWHKAGDLWVRDADPHDAALAEALGDALNRHSAENGSNTPDFILGEFLRACLQAFDVASRRREEWYGVELAIGGPRSLREDG